MVYQANFKKSPILITGGAGFIGSSLAHRLLEKDIDLAILTKKTTQLSRLKDILPKVKIFNDDLSDPVRLEKLISKIKPRGIFHCAASTIKSGVSASENELIRVNLLGTMHLLQALSKIEYKFFINCGTLVEYGTKNYPPKETDPCEPVEMYALSKLAATLYCQTIARITGRPILTFRLFTPYGPNMEEGRLFYEVVKRALENREIILTQPEVNRDFIFIDDLINLYIEAMDKAEKLKGEIFNLASGESTTLKEFVDLVIQLTNSKSKIKWGGVKEVSYDRACWQADMEKTFENFSWRPVCKLNTGIFRMVEWFNSRPKF